LSSDSFGTRSTLKTAHGSVEYNRLETLSESGVSDVSRLPFSIKVLLEALLRSENGMEVSRHDVEALARYNPLDPGNVEVPFKPGRVILQDFTGVPAVVDLAALRSAMAELGGDPKRINPRVPVDLVIDHSVQVDRFASPMALKDNAAIEFSRNRERYAFLRWGQQAFENFRVVPPASGIVHQVNLEYLARVVDLRDGVAFPDSLVGTDSHTTMINGLGVVGWGVGGIEAEAVMLGQPIYMLAPEVVGFKLTGALPEGTTATDLVLTITQILREHGVVGRFVEFYGPGLSTITLPDRATIANMAPEYGATMGFFPVDSEVLSYLRATGRDEKLVDLVERYTKEQGLYRTDNTPAPQFKESLSLDLSRVWPSLAGPKRPQDRTPLSMMKETFRNDLRSDAKTRGFRIAEDRVGDRASVKLGDREAELAHGSVAIAAITSCTNTSNPSVMLAAGLLAKKAVEAGLSVPPYVKTSLAPGSKVVTEYLTRTGLMPHLEQLGFHVVGYGCTTCIGNSGPLPDAVARAVEEHDLVLAGVLSGNRNFEGRINPHVRANYLASPPLVVAYALAGTVDVNLTTDPVGTGRDGRAVYLKDIWPSVAEITELFSISFDPETFRRVYDGIESSNEEWNAIPVSGGDLYQWDEASTYIQQPPFFVGMSREPRPIEPIEGARVLVKVGDSITTDHISPAGAFAVDSPAGRYLVEQGVEPRDFNSYGSRRGNDRVMTRGTFANIRLRNELAPGTEGGYTTHFPSGEVTTIFEAAGRYREAGTPTVVLAGDDYGMGSSRDWAAKGTYLLGVRAVIAQSFERIHRSNLVGMGVLPLELSGGETVESLGLTGRETFTVAIDDELQPRQDVLVTVAREDGSTARFTVRARVDTPVEVEYYRNYGILHTVLRQMLRG
jgi:aconitate hydratase